MADNRSAVREVYEGFAKGDVPAVLGLMDPKIDWQEPDSLPFGSHNSPEAVAENVFGGVLSMIDDFTVVASEMVSEGDTVCAIGRYSGKGKTSGKDLDTEFVHVWRFGADGKITGFRTHTDTHLWREALGTN